VTREGAVEVLVDRDAVLLLEVGRCQKRDSKLKSKQASEHAREQESHLLEVGRGARQQRGVALGAFLHLVELGCVQRLPGLRAQLVRDAC